MENKNQFLCEEKGADTLRLRRIASTIWGGALLKQALVRFTHPVLFSSKAFQASLRPLMKKALRFHARLSLVAGVGEPLARRSQTSNFELLKDLAEVIDYMNSWIDAFNNSTFSCHQFLVDFFQPQLLNL